MPCPHPCPCTFLPLLRSPAGEILVVWNRGPPPDPRTAFQSEVPVRVRVEPLNSMNNRFRPDPGMKFRWVFGAGCALSMCTSERSGCLAVTWAVVQSDCSVPGHALRRPQPPGNHGSSTFPSTPSPPSSGCMPHPPPSLL